MGSDLLRELGESDDAAARAARIYRERDEVMVREMARLRHDDKDYVSAAREAHRSLDELMRGDIEAARAGEN